MNRPPYARYKPSGVDWLGSIPANWSTVPLKHVTDFVNGMAFKPDQWSVDGVPIIRIENLNGSPDFNGFQGAVSQKYHVGKGDLLFGWSGNRGTSFGPFLWWRDGRHYLNQHIFKLENFDCDKGWLYWCLKAVTRTIEDEAHGIIGMVHVTRGKLGAVRVPEVSLGEQRAIANFLDRRTRAIDELIRKKERLIELLQEKRQALITQAVTKGLDPNVPMKDSGVPWLGEIPAHWEVKKLRWVLRQSPRNGVSPPNSGAAITPTFSIAAVRDGIVRIADNIKFADIDPSDAFPFRVGHGDVLVMRGNGSLDLVGSAGIVNEEPPEGCIYPDILIRLRGGTTIRPLYLVSILNSQPLRAQVETAARTAAGIWKISGGSLAAFRIPLPSVEEQETIIRHIAEATGKSRHAVDLVVRQIDRLREYRQALISAAVTGQIEVTCGMAPQTPTLVAYEVQGA